MNSQQRRKFRRKWKYIVAVPNDRLFGAEQWCIEHYGQKKYNRSHLLTPIPRSNIFGFESAETAMDFTLKWVWSE